MKYESIFERIIEKEPSNIFKKFLFRYRLHKFYRSIETMSPSYDDMMEMSSIIKISEHIFFHHNNIKYLDGDILPVTYTECGTVYIAFNLSDFATCTIALIKGKTINVEVKNITNNKITTNISFKDRELDIDNALDEKLFSNIISIMMRSFVDLIKYCRSV